MDKALRSFVQTYFCYDLIHLILLYAFFLIFSYGLIPSLCTNSPIGYVEVTDHVFVPLYFT